MNLIPEGSLKYLLAQDSNPTGEIGAFTSFVVGDRASGMYVQYHGANGTVLYTTPTMDPRTVAK